MPDHWDNPPKSAVTVNFGGEHVLKLGARRFDFGDSYHAILAMSWPKFFAALIPCYLLVNTLFALAYLAQDGSIANARPGSFMDAFFFSIETLATVGYGHMNPASLYGHLVASVEIFTGMLGFAVITGLVFSRFSKPTARILLSRNAVVAPFNGCPTLMLRAANERHNQILEASVRVTLVRQEITQEGETVRRFHDLLLERDRSAVFALSWTIMHPISADSPLHGMSAADLSACDARLIVTLNGMDETLVQPVHWRQDYPAADILFGHRFVDIVRTAPDGRRSVDLTRFHDVQAIS